MRPILPGARGPAVEDIQRRLLRLGYKLGPTGVDGVFLGRTRDALLSFQSTLGLTADGVVGDDTWAALVDETFTLGDRTLYLRLPHFHGKDVTAAQEALNSLGFACGDLDGIFGAYSERAVREFQRNSGIPADGILGLETIQALMSLRHVWEGKDSTIPTGALTGPVRSGELLASLRLRIGFIGEYAGLVSERLVNLAQASAPGCAIRLHTDPAAPADGLEIALTAQELAPEGAPAVAVGSDALDAFAARLSVGLELAGDRGLWIQLPPDAQPSDPEVSQRVAVRVLDGLCAALA